MSERIIPTRRAALALGKCSRCFKDLHDGECTPTQPDDLRVWNKRKGDAPPNAVYVGRPSKWGNPFTIKDYTREEAIERYRMWLDQDAPKLKEAARIELRGKHLVCWCAPLACHADVLLEIANAD